MLHKANREAEAMIFSTEEGEKRAWAIGNKDGKEFFETEDGGEISFAFGHPEIDFRYKPPGGKASLEAKAKKKKEGDTKCGTD